MWPGSQGDALHVLYTDLTHHNYLPILHAISPDTTPASHMSFAHNALWYLDAPDRAVPAAASLSYIPQAHPHARSSCLGDNIPLCTYIVGVILSDDNGCSYDGRAGP